MDEDLSGDEAGQQLRVHEIGCLIARKSKLPKMMASEEDKYCEPDG